MRYHRDAIVERALLVLDTYGLADLSMRRLGTELGIQPGALYHHFANKQTLLAAIADEILARGRRPRVAGAWDVTARGLCSELRDAMLAYRDGAELVSTVHAFGLGALEPGRELQAGLLGAGLTAELAETATSTLLHFVFGHTLDEQIHLQADSLGALDGSATRRSDFALGLDLILDGIRAQQVVPSSGTSPETK